MEYTDFLEMLVALLGVSLIVLFIILIIQSNTVTELCDEIKHKRMPLPYNTRHNDIIGSVLDERQYYKRF